MHAQPSQPGQVSPKSSTDRQLHYRRATSHLCHGTFVQILEWLGLRALQQPFDGFPDVASGLKRGGPESGQHVTSFAVRDGRDIADGEDSRMVFHLEVGSNRNAAAMNQLDAQG